MGASSEWRLQSSSLIKGLQGVAFWERGRPARNALARVTLTLAFSHKGLTRVGLRPWERGRPRPQSRACARRTLTLALSHKGRGDLSLAIHAWFRMAGLSPLSRG